MRAEVQNLLAGTIGPNNSIEGEGGLRHDHDQTKNHVSGRAWTPALDCTERPEDYSGWFWITPAEPGASFARYVRREEFGYQVML